MRLNLFCNKNSKTINMLYIDSFVILKICNKYYKNFTKKLMQFLSV